MTAATPVVRVRGLVNRFGSQVVHDGLDLEVREGEILGVVGGSGSGKSVLMRSILLSVGIRAVKYAGMGVAFYGVARGLRPALAALPVWQVLVGLISGEGGAALPVPTTIARVAMLGSASSSPTTSAATAFLMVRRCRAATARNTNGAIVNIMPKTIPITLPMNSRPSTMFPTRCAHHRGPTAMTRTASSIEAMTAMQMRMSRLRETRSSGPTVVLSARGAGAGVSVIPHCGCL